MDAITKWNLDQILTQAESQIVLEELFGGSKKEFNYSSEEPIDKTLYRIYDNFKDATGSECVLRFTSRECTKPFVSLAHIDNSFSHTIKTDAYTIYIYE